MEEVEERLWSSSFVLETLASFTSASIKQLLYLFVVMIRGGKSREVQENFVQQAVDTGLGTGILNTRAEQLAEDPDAEYEVVCYAVFCQVGNIISLHFLVELSDK